MLTISLVIQTFMFDRILSNDSWNVNISFHRLVESINGVYSLWTLPWNDLLIRHSKHSLLDVVLSFLVKYLIFWTRSSSVLLLYDLWWLNHVTQSRAVLSCFTMFSHVSPCDLQCSATELFPESRVPFWVFPCAEFHGWVAQFWNNHVVYRELYNG